MPTATAIPRLPRLPRLPRAKIARWASTWGLPDLATRVTVEISPRLTASLARCTVERAQIRLHPALATVPAALLEAVLCHELAHIAAFELHGPDIRPHGAEWQALVRQAGFEPRVRLELVGPEPADTQTWQTTAPPPARKRAPRFSVCHVCPSCGMQRWARRAVPRWRCRSCVEAGKEGLLRIERVPE